MTVHDPAAAAAGKLVRHRDAADSRERLLRAAHQLFSERGYQRTTVRDIGQRAEVDPAMIARYFGSKAALYLTSIRRDPPDVRPMDLADPEVTRQLLDRVEMRGPTPTLHAVVTPHEDDVLQRAALDVLDQFLLQPARARAEAHGSGDDAELRAELVTAALAGVALSRASGAFTTLATAPAADVAQLVSQLVGRFLSPDSATGALDGRVDPAGENRRLRERAEQLEQENETLRRATADLARGVP